MNEKNNIANFRESKAGKESTYNHLINSQDMENQEKGNFSPNKLYTWNRESQKMEGVEFVRNGTNQAILKQLHKKDRELEEMARIDYTSHKTPIREQENQKAIIENRKPKKVKTQLSHKKGELTKEFGIFLGGLMKITDKADFEDKALNACKALLEAKGLTQDNIICLVIHWDEKTPHIHCKFNNYSMEHHTTGTEVFKVREKEGFNSKEINLLNRSNFASLQDLTAEKMEMDRGQKGSKAIHLHKAQHFEEVAKNYDALEVASKAVSEQIEDKNKVVNAIDELLQHQQKQGIRKIEEIETERKNKARDLLLIKSDKERLTQDKDQLIADNKALRIENHQMKSNNEALALANEEIRAKLKESEEMAQMVKEQHKKNNRVLLLENKAIQEKIKSNKELLEIGENLERLPEAKKLEAINLCDKATKKLIEQENNTMGEIFKKFGNFIQSILTRKKTEQNYQIEKDQIKNQSKTTQNRAVKELEREEECLS